jgi:protein-tyrosine-phosphatase
MARSVLFVCNMNSVRSPMAAAILAQTAKGNVAVDSAGLFEGGVDPFVEAVLAEIGLTLDQYEPKSLRETPLPSFDLIVALTPEAAEAVRRLAPAAPMEFWPIANPSEAAGGREALLAAYRAVRDELSARIRKRFPASHQSP